MIERTQSAMFGEFAHELIASGKSFRFCARGRSMNPTIQDGDTLHVEPITGAPKIGEIVFFSLDGEFKAHRVVARSGSGFVTRGDAGIEFDGVVSQTGIVGRVVAVERKDGRTVSMVGLFALMKFVSRELRRKISALLRQE
jgi:SOS-response transcriptional repressor LexA